MDKKTFRVPVTVGAASLLTVFAVLCLVVFALLSLSTVSADERLSRASAEAVKGYYEADQRAEELLAQLRGGTVPEGIKKEGSVYSYACPISDTQTLAVEVMVDGEDYEILRWQAVSTVSWESDDSIPVWDGK